jgi:DNA-3-methyladenine glycosylase I
MPTYCDIAPGHQWHGPYHDREYGFPLEDDAELFERLMLEINQAGLSWLTILKKRAAFQRAYGGFVPDVWRRTVHVTGAGFWQMPASSATS